MTQTVATSCELALDHRAYYLGSSLSGHIVACSQTGQISVVGPQRSVIGSFAMNTRVKSIAVAPDGRQLAIALEDQIEIVDPSGARLDAIDGTFEDLGFDASGRLWTARHEINDPDTFCVEVFEGYKPTPHELRLEDPFGESAIWLPKHPTAAQIPIWIAAGQDGQTLYWADLDGQRLDAEQMTDVYECGPPVVSRWNDEFLLFTNENMLSRYSLFDCELIGSARLFPAGNDHGLGLSIVYVSQKEALVIFQNDLLYRVDLETLKVIEPVVVAGHEPRPTRELYPSLDEDNECSDIADIFLVGDDIVSLHLQLPDRELRQHGTLAWWSGNRQDPEPASSTD